VGYRWESSVFRLLRAGRSRVWRARISQGGYQRVRRRL